MRFAYVASCYTSYLEGFYATRPLLAFEPYATQESALARDCFGWNGCWPAAMTAAGYQARDFYVGIPALDRAWEREHGKAPDSLGPYRVAIRQLQEFAPDVVLFDHHDADFLRALRQALGNPLMLGWEGSALGKQACWPLVDLMLSCAPESVDIIRAAGIASEHLHHGFNPAVLEQLPLTAKSGHLAFIGQLVRESAFHLQREAMLVRIADAGLPFDLYSPSHAYGGRDSLQALAKIGVYLAYQAGARLPLVSARIPRLPYAYLGARGRGMPKMPVNPRLRPHLRPACFGIAMYSRIAESSVCLNIHADSSPHYASNMRLFETSGVGTCLLTDARHNLSGLFEADREIMVYESVEDCIEKIGWLLAHPLEAAQIAAAGQSRTLKDHTFARRAEVLDAHIQAALRRRHSVGK